MLRALDSTESRRARLDAGALARGVDKYSVELQKKGLVGCDTSDLSKNDGGYTVFNWFWRPCLRCGVTRITHG